MTARAKPYFLAEPWTSQKIEQLDEMLRILFDDLRNGNLSIGPGQINVSGFDDGDLLYINASGLLDGLPVGAANTVLRSTGSLPQWGPLNLSTDVIGTLGIANGGTGATNATDAFGNLSPLTTEGDLLTHNGSDNIRLAVGADGEVLTVTAGVPTWEPASAGSGDVVGPGSSVDGEIVLFDGTTGKLIRAAVGSGVVHATSGVYSTSDVLLGEIEPASAASVLLGRGDSGAGDFEEITLGTGLTMTGTTLSSTGGTGAPHDLLSLEHPDTFPGSPVVGDLIFAKITGEIVSPGVYGGGGWVDGADVQQLTAGRGVLSTWVDGASEGNFLNAFAPTIYTAGLWDRLAIGGTGDFLSINSDSQPAWVSSISLTADVSGVLPIANGGTAIASYVVGDLLYASATGTLSRLADVATGSVLASGGVGVAPAWSSSPAFSGANVTALNAGNISSGTLLVARGGTGLTAFGGTNTLLYTTAASALSSIATANSQVLVTNGSGVPAWSATLPAVSGANLTSLNAGNISSGILVDARLSSNVPLINGTNAFTGANSFATNALNLLVGQITFPATQNPSAGVNVLDDYEEGTWTPTDASGAGLAFAVGSARYTKVGRLVSACFDLLYPATASGASAIVGSLPFTVGAAAGSGSVGFGNVGLSITFYLRPGTTNVEIYTVGGGNITNTQMSGKTITMAATYFV
ncbi:MAG: hypothetical protein LC723_14270 [Actinobacteria bacterium]|nr:hypothetical protein [Actinomycetota bacterium]